MVCVAGRTVAADFGVYVCSARDCVGVFFENQSSGAFSENKSASSFIEGDGRCVHVLGRGESLAVAESGNGKGRYRGFGASADCCIGVSSGDEAVSLADGQSCPMRMPWIPQRSRRERRTLLQCFRLRYCLSFLG